MQIWQKIVWWCELSLNLKVATFIDGKISENKWQFKCLLRQHMNCEMEDCWKIGVLLPYIHMSCRKAKPTKWHVPPVKTQSLIRFRCELTEKLRTQGFFMRTVKTLIRLGGCPGWSETLLGAHAILLVLSWGGSVIGFWWSLIVAFIGTIKVLDSHVNSDSRKKNPSCMVFGLKLVLNEFWCGALYVLSANDWRHNLHNFYA